MKKRIVLVLAGLMTATMLMGCFAGKETKNPIDSSDREDRSDSTYEQDTDETTDEDWEETTNEEEETEDVLAGVDKDLVNAYLSAGFVLEDDKLILTYEAAQKYFDPIAEMIREGNPEVLNYFYNANRTKDLKNLDKLMNEEYNTPIWQALFSDFKFFYGDYNLEDEERLSEECVRIYLDELDEECFAHLAYKPHRFLYLDNWMDVNNVSYDLSSTEALITACEDVVANFPAFYSTYLTCKIEDGVFKISTKLFSDNIFDGIPSYDSLRDWSRLFETTDSKAYVRIDLDNKDVTDKYHDCMVYFNYCANKQYLEAMQYAIDHEVVPDYSIESFKEYLEKFNSLSKEDQDEILAKIDAYPDGKVAFFACTNEGSDYVSGTLMNYCSRVDWDHGENLFDDPNALEINYRYFTSLSVDDVFPLLQLLNDYE